MWLPLTGITWNYCDIIIGWKTILDISFSGEVGSINKHPSMVRYKRWEWNKDSNKTCHGKFLRNICLMSVGDLYLIPQRPELFLNKIVMSTNHIAYQCLEYFHYNRTKAEYLGTVAFDTTFYANLEFVLNHVWVW